MFIPFPPHPTTLPDHLVRQAIQRARVLLRDGAFEVEAQFERWDRSAGTRQLVAIVRNPLNRSRWVVGVLNRTGQVRVLGRAH